MLRPVAVYNNFHPHVVRHEADLGDSLGCLLEVAPFEGRHRDLVLHFGEPPPTVDSGSYVGGGDARSDCCYNVGDPVF